MAKPKPIKLMEAGMITQQALLAYAEGRLSDSERQEMDKLLKADPFAQEALEGLRRADHIKDIPATITAINTHLREKSGIRERKKKGIQIHWTVYAYAAVIIAMLIGVGFVLIHVMSQRAMPIAENVTPQVVPIVAPRKEEPKPDSAQMAMMAQRNDSIANARNDSINAANAPKNADTTAISTYMYTDKASTVVSAAASSPPTTPTVIVPNTKEVSEALLIAKGFFDNADYANAEKKYNEILAKQPNNIDALYFGGVSSYLNNSKTLGEPNFDKLAKTSMYTDGTKWYKANILIRHGQKAAAKELLRDLINTNSIFKDRAVKEYEEMYK